MKIGNGLRNYLISALCLVIPLSVGIWYYLIYTPGRFSRVDEFASIQVTEDPDSIYIHSLVDLPYSEYRRKTDSVRHLQQMYTMHLGTAVFAYPFGVGRYMECNDCFNGWRGMDWGKGADKCYLLVGGFKRDIRITADYLNRPVYYRKRGQSYLKYVQYDTVYNNGKSGRPALEGRWVNKPIRYQAEKVADSDQEEMRLMVPVSKTTYRCWQVSMFVILGAGLVLCWLCFRKFVQVLVEIARGDAFSVRNYRRLFFIANAIGLYVIGTLLIRLVLQWSLAGYYSGDLVIIVDWPQNIKWLLLGVVFYFIARAFKKGYHIQQEQELTI